MFEADALRPIFRERRRKDGGECAITDGVHGWREPRVEHLTHPCSQLASRGVLDQFAPARAIGIGLEDGGGRCPQRPVGETLEASDAEGVACAKRARAFEGKWAVTIEHRGDDAEAEGRGARGRRKDLVEVVDVLHRADACHAECVKVSCRASEGGALRFGQRGRDGGNDQLPRSLLKEQSSRRTVGSAFNRPAGNFVREVELRECRAIDERDMPIAAPGDDRAVVRTSEPVTIRASTSPLSFVPSAGFEPDPGGQFAVARRDGRLKLIATAAPREIELREREPSHEEMEMCVDEAGQHPSLRSVEDVGGTDAECLTRPRNSVAFKCDAADPSPQWIACPDPARDNPSKGHMARLPTPVRTILVSMIRRAALVLVLVASSSCRDSTPAPKPPTPIVPKGSSARAPQPPTTPVTPSAPATPRASEAAKAMSTSTSDPALIEIAGLRMPKPVSWTWESPSVQFRALQYAVPAQGGGSGAAELIFSVFAAGDGGPIDANVQRWVSQFRGEDGGGATAKIEDRAVAQIPVKLIELSGSYQGMGQAAPRPGMSQLGAILQPPGSTVFVRLIGPTATVEGNRADFMAMIDALTLAP